MSSDLREHTTQVPGFVILDDPESSVLGSTAEKAETIELLTKGAAAAAAVIRGLSDDQLAKSGTVLTGALPMTAEQLITGGLIDHIDDHFGSIRKMVGH